MIVYCGTRAQFTSDVYGNVIEAKILAQLRQRAGHSAGDTKRELLHPSYQAWTCASLIRDFDKTVQQEWIRLQPCAYLHNCISG